VLGLGIAALSSAKSFSASSGEWILTTPLRPMAGSFSQMTTRRRCSGAWAAPGAKMAMSSRLRLPSIVMRKSRATSSTEMPYSWNSARAMRWRTCSLAVSLTGWLLM